MASPRSFSPEPPTGPQPIRRLQEALINRIAAGEIIQRPASALKELLENSLDAGATSIRVTIKDGGLKLLQIQDNGCGIRKTDLPILAERHTTSKLSTFADLTSLKTYGFRGEALASISHVAHLSVITKTKTDSCAWKAIYANGALVPSKPGHSVDPKPCAGNDGTTITAEDLFYNTPTRRSALRSSSEEYSRILDVLTRYAVHNPTVAFVCKKAGSANADLSTPSNSSTTQAIRLLYGQSIARDLLSVSLSPDKGTSGNDEAGAEAINVDDSVEIEGEGNWKGEAHFTNANYHAKKMVFLLFINHRLVESPRIKRALESVYSAILPKGTSPFIYLSLEIDPRAVDVNVHPTKREVHFLNEEAIIERVADTIQHALASQGRSRVFEYQTQTLLTGGTLDTGKDKDKKGKGKEKASSQDDADASNGEEEVVAAAKHRLAYSKDKVRVSQADRTLDSMFPVLDPATQPAEAVAIGRDKDKGKSKSKGISKYRVDNVDQEEEERSLSIGESPGQTSTVGRTKAQEIVESECFLSSVRDLRKALGKKRHSLLTEIVQKHVFVGIVDLPRSLSLVQYETKLYLVNHAALAEELFYQLGLRQFGNFARLKLEPPPPIRHLVRLAVHTEDGRWKACGLALEEEEVVDRIVTKLTANAPMLDEYFSLGITADGSLASIPLLLRGYTPDLARLPLFLMRLGPQVSWTHERDCFSSFLRELAYFYSPGSLDAARADASEAAAEKAERWQIEHVLFPCARKYLQPPRTLLDRDVVQVASLPDLYRVFERC
ncbi:hypothetical protein M0805_002991 [Coniferiporia weirii]|nr:hypothetical protein M0805_002991 [Coniferiporia weirii]